MGLDTYTTASSNDYRCQLCGARFLTSQGEVYCAPCLEAIRSGRVALPMAKSGTRED